MTGFVMTTIGIETLGPDQFADWVIRVLAQLKLGQLQGLSVSVIDAMGKEEAGAYLAPGCPKLLLLKNQINLLTDDEK